MIVLGSSIDVSLILMDDLLFISKHEIKRVYRYFEYVIILILTGASSNFITILYDEFGKKFPYFLGWAIFFQC